jgi:tight adherence protein B
VVLIVALILVALAIGFIVYTVANNLFNTYSFSDQIASYNRFRETFDSGEGVEEVEQSRFGATKNFIVQKAVETAERVAEERGILSRVESALERANLAIKPAEFIVLYVAIVIALPLVGLYLGGLLIMLAFGFVAAFAPIALLSNMAERRRSKFLAQLPDTLHLLAGSLRAGYSLMQGVEAVSEETPEPIAQELRRVITETRLGGDLIESLDKVALRMNSQDFGWVVMGISIQSEVGGDLAELLDTVSETMVERQRLRREIKALTAEGRISALVLICLPIALLIILNFMNPEYGSALFTSTLGQILLLLGGLSLILGWLWMKKIVAIKV